MAAAGGPAPALSSGPAPPRRRRRLLPEAEPQAEEGAQPLEVKREVTVAEREGTGTWCPGRPAPSWTVEATASSARAICSKISHYFSFTKGTLAKTTKRKILLRQERAAGKEPGLRSRSPPHLVLGWTVGAWASRRRRARVPAREPEPEEALDLSQLPPELLLLVLSHVPPRTLLACCRRVWRGWRALVDSQALWLRILAREQVAVLLLIRSCLPTARDERPFLLSRLCELRPIGRNLIRNP
ncbi:uncharacterized protein LOC121103647 [Ursus maritimus]|uniref:Uncharacterized protein LOC121103647 n=1 Tax=Ursus maritimus TaxID=29073 RepID=A0A8M1G477_URSMA|nr:uncharacterized protein LOC121103647 [Ursus maritimus]